MTTRTAFESYARLAAVAAPPLLGAVVWLLVRDFEHIDAERRMVRDAPPVPMGAPAASASTAPSPPAPAPQSASAVFEHIYEAGVWGTNDAGEGTSGSGSTLESTAVYRAFLQAFMKEHDIHSVVDAGCGDWEFSSKIDWRGIDYKGFDIAHQVVEHDKKLYTKPNIHFFEADIVETDLPKADLLISKHVLQHLPNASVKKFLEKQLPKYKHVLIMSGVHHVTFAGENTDISPGGYRTLDLTAPPFNVVGLKTLNYFDGYHMHTLLHVGKKHNDAAP